MNGDDFAFSAKNISKSTAISDKSRIFAQTIM